MTREYPTSPVIGVGAVILDGERVLLIRRGHEPMKGQWSIPGGALEVGESLLDGVVREVREETGLEVEPIRLIEVLDRIVRDDDERVRFHYVLIDYLCRVTGGALCCATDATEARWASVKELDGVAAFTVSVIEKSVQQQKEINASNE